MQALDVITYGEAMALFVATEPGDLGDVTSFVKRAAGAELNVAIGLARLGFKVGWASRVGADSFGRFVLKTLKDENIDIGAVTVDDRYRTGFQLKSRSDDGSDPQIEYFRKGSAASHLSLADYQPEYFGAARHLHLSGVAPAISETSFALALHIAQEMRAAGKSISFDPNLRPTLWASRGVMIERLNMLAAYADWIMPGLEEGRILTGLQTPREIADFYLAGGAKGVVIKLGEKGAYVRTAEREITVDALPVANVVDTVGAGDGFAVGVISALLEGRDLAFAVERGNRIGGMAIQVIGDSEGLPTRARLDQEELKK
ncbi:sugar kinase [Glaciimonas sp. PAMC28666]|uniref:sugar kinase n=1 Tax=Glaciimonas sp. PAMC28666 TaxID=2807626 RepID=UPI0019660EDF|nr:sugar kinase [Glaciimonas sp. PAMC28666]QRX84162.1 sugar kinase [Glaciimonas sp. PAMC28666]